MSNDRKDRFWTGPIRSHDHARKIILRLAVTFWILAALATLSMIGGVDTSKVVLAGILGALGIALKLSESRVVAIIALVLTALPPITSAIVGGVSLSAGMVGMGITMFMAGLLWGILTLACGRGVAAAQALRKLPDEPIEETFA